MKQQQRFNKILIMNKFLVFLYFVVSCFCIGGIITTQFWVLIPIIVFYGVAKILERRIQSLKEEEERQIESYRKAYEEARMREEACMREEARIRNDAHIKKEKERAAEAQKDLESHSYYYVEKKYGSSVVVGPIDLENMVKLYKSDKISLLTSVKFGLNAELKPLKEFKELTEGLYEFL